MVKHGREKLLFESLERKDEVEVPVYEWAWSSLVAGPHVTELLGGNTELPPLWSYWPIVSQQILSRFSTSQLPENEKRLRGDMSWKEVVELVGEWRSDAEKENREVINKVQVLDFRISIIESVLNNFDVYGHVPQFDEFRHLVEDSTALAIVEKGLELLDGMPEEEWNRAKLTAEIAEELEKGEARHVQDLLTRRGLYPKTEGSGRPTKIAEENLFNEMISLWRRFYERAKASELKGK